MYCFGQNDLKNKTQTPQKKRKKYLANLCQPFTKWTKINVQNAEMNYWMGTFF